MIRWIKSLFAWRKVREVGVWAYWENAVTGRRCAMRYNTGGHSPIDIGWLLEGTGMPLIDGIPAWRSRYRRCLPDGRYWS